MKNLFLVIIVPSPFLDLATWRCTEELILERNYFPVISVVSHYLHLVIWRCIKEFDILQLQFICNLIFIMKIVFGTLHNYFFNYNFSDENWLLFKFSYRELVPKKILNLSLIGINLENWFKKKFSLVRNDTKKNSQKQLKPRKWETENAYRRRC